jgi:hypothetical protein
VSGGRFGWEQAEERGMFREPYDEAFQIFLSIIGEKRPAAVDSPIVGLFLLICDIALNPTSGFPCDIDFESDFVSSSDPGMRFFNLCKAAAREKTHLADSILRFSREEYVEAGRMLTEACGYAEPLVSTQTVCNWMGLSPEIRRFAAMQQSFTFPPENYAVAFLFSHFLEFSKDKHASPELFCWPGKYLAGPKLTQKMADLFEKHGPPFVDKADGAGIFPRLKGGLAADKLNATFLAFYQFIVV